MTRVLIQGPHVLTAGDLPPAGESLEGSYLELVDCVGFDFTPWRLDRFSMFRCDLRNATLGPLRRVIARRCRLAGATLPGDLPPDAHDFVFEAIRQNYGGLAPGPKAVVDELTAFMGTAVDADHYRKSWPNAFAHLTVALSRTGPQIAQAAQDIFAGYPRLQRMAQRLGERPEMWTATLDADTPSVRVLTPAGLVSHNLSGQISGQDAYDVRIRVETRLEMLLGEPVIARVRSVSPVQIDAVVKGMVPGDPAEWRNRDDV